VFLDNGMYIAYLKRGIGQQLKEDDVVLIDYKSALTDGKVFDTNEKIGKPIPFMIGWGLQTSGWDIALPYLNEGDVVKVFLPAKFARGEKGIPDIVPPNSDNLISLKIHKILPADYTVDGVQIWVINRGKDQVDLKEGDEVYIDYFAHAKTKPRYDNSFKNGEPYQIKVGGKNNLPGLNMALSKAKLSDKLWVRIPAKHAFGSKGNQDLVKPNETVFFDLRVLKIIEE
jgi:FKBP-type peptidyl-prolyl cis-trans isomerase